MCSFFFFTFSKGKDVVTANKALIAQFMPEIQELLKANPSVKFCYEAAVCGGMTNGFKYIVMLSIFLSFLPLNITLCRHSCHPRSSF